MTAVALGVVGCGRVTEAAYVPALARVPAVRLVAVADTDPGRRRSVAAAAAAATGKEAPATYESADALLDGAAVDAVILATPVDGRWAMAKAAVGAGVGVLVEKPPALDAEEAARLADLGPALWVGLNRRFDPGVAEMRDIAAAHSPVELRLSISYRRGAWGAFTVRDDAILDLGPHLVDLALWLADAEILEVATRSLTAARTEIELRLDGASALLSAATDRVHHELIEVRDTAGGTIGRRRIGGLSAAVRDRLGQGPGMATLVDSIAAQLDDFAVAVQGGQPSRLATARDGWTVMAAIDAARISAATGAPVPMPSIPIGRGDRPTARRP